MASVWVAAALVCALNIGCEPQIDRQTMHETRVACETANSEVADRVRQAYPDVVISYSCVEFKLDDVNKKPPAKGGVPL